MKDGKRKRGRTGNYSNACQCITEGVERLSKTAIDQEHVFGSYEKYTVAEATKQ